jgi:hypothetical protein
VRILLLVALILVPRITAAQDPPPQPVQELFLTEVVYPQDKGELQLTLSALVDRTRSDLSALIPFSIEYGLSDRWQIQAAWAGSTQFHHAPFKHLRTEQLSIGTKYSLMNIAHSPAHAAFGVDVEFPYASFFAEDSDDRVVEFEPFIAAAIDLGRRITIFGSASASFEPREVKALVETGEHPDDPGNISVGILKAFQRVTLAAEYTSHSDDLPWRRDGTALITPSVVVHPSGNWELAAGVPFGIEHGYRRPGLAINIIKEFD